MIQGGDPTGTGRGGTSIYGEKFADEIHPQLRFVGAGILAMANSGPNTNGTFVFPSFYVVWKTVGRLISLPLPPLRRVQALNISSRSLRLLSWMESTRYLDGSALG